MTAPAALPILLYDGGCATCIHIAHWVENSASRSAGGPKIIVRPVGNDPAELRQLNPALDIWDAYAVIHLIMPDGSMLQGGEAVAEVLRRLPLTHWLTPCFAANILGVRPFQQLLTLGYHILDDIRPILGCESCGRTKAWVRPFERLTHWLRTRTQPAAQPLTPLHFRPLPARSRQPPPLHKS